MLPIVGSLSVIPLLVCFYPLIYFVKDFDERIKNCGGYTMESMTVPDAQSLSLLNLGKLYTYSGQQLAVLLALVAATVGLIFSTSSMEAEEHTHRNSRLASPERATPNRQEEIFRSISQYIH